MHQGKRELLTQLEAEKRLEAYEERAAILEHDAGIPRMHAEALAKLKHPPPWSHGPKQRP